jgi:phasin family protein
MNADVLEGVAEKGKAMLEPAQKLGQLMIANAEKLSEIQLAAAKAYSDMGLGQMKAAVEVKDMAGLKGYAEKQAEALKTVGERLVADAKAVTEMASAFSTEAQSITKDAASSALGKSTSA